MTDAEKKVLNAFVTAAVGDAMGAVTETRSTKHIKERFGGLVTEILDPPCDNLAHDTPRGHVTDDFSIAYFSAEEFLAADSRPTKELSEKALVRWYDYGDYNRYIGPSTEGAICALKGIPNPRTKKDPLAHIKVRLLCENSRATNGGGMKAGLIGILNPGNVERAIEEAIIFCMPTHDNTIGISAGCAIAAATARAMAPGATDEDALEAGIYGAKVGFERAKEIARPVAGCNIEKKIRLAIRIGSENKHDFEKAMDEIFEVIGTGLYAYEAIPAVFGCIAACEGRLKDSVIMAVNAGNDTDTVACMVGYIVGALSLTETFPEEYIDLIDQANGFDLRGVAAKLAAFNSKEA